MNHYTEMFINFYQGLVKNLVIVFDDQVRPLSRKYIAQKLIEVSEKIN